MQQLAGGIGTTLAAIERSLNQIREDFDHYQVVLDKVLSMDGLKDLDEVRQMLESRLTIDERISYNKQIHRLRMLEPVAGRILDASLLLAYISSQCGFASPTVTALTDGALAASMNLFGYAYLRGSTGKTT